MVIVLFLHGVGLPSHLLDAYLLGMYEAKSPTPDQVSARLFEVTKIWQQKRCNPFTNRVSSPYAMPDLFYFFQSSLLDQKVGLADVGQGEAGEGRCRDHMGPIKHMGFTVNFSWYPSLQGNGDQLSTSPT